MPGVQLSDLMSDEDEDSTVVTEPGADYILGIVAHSVRKVWDDTQVASVLQLFFRTKWWEPEDQRQASGVPRENRTWEPEETFMGHHRHTLKYCTAHARRIRTSIREARLLQPSLVFVPVGCYDFSRAMESDDEESEDDADSVSVCAPPSPPTSTREAPSGYTRTKTDFHREYMHSQMPPLPKRRKPEVTQAPSSPDAHEEPLQATDTISITVGTRTLSFGVTYDGIMVDSCCTIAERFAMLDNEYLMVTCGQYVAARVDDTFMISADLITARVVLTLNGTDDPDAPPDSSPSPQDTTRVAWSSPVPEARKDMFIRAAHQVHTSTQLLCPTRVCSRTCSTTSQAPPQSCTRRR